jgi:hypothetical protein
MQCAGASGGERRTTAYSVSKERAAGIAQHAILQSRRIHCRPAKPHNESMAS